MNMNSTRLFVGPEGGIIIDCPDVGTVVEFVKLMQRQDINVRTSVQGNTLPDRKLIKVTSTEKRKKRKGFRSHQWTEAEVDRLCQLVIGGMKAANIARDKVLSDRHTPASINVVLSRVLNNDTKNVSKKFLKKYNSSMEKLGVGKQAEEPKSERGGWFARKG